MRESIMSPSNAPPSVGRLHPEQIATRATWSRVPDALTGVAAMHVIHVDLRGQTTSTVLNPLDPATVEDVVAAGVDDGMGRGWLERPGGIPTAIAAGR
jgi:hypothetical protein